MTDLDSGRNEVVLPGISMSEFEISPDGERVAFTARMRMAPHVWVGLLDRRTPPRQLTSSVARMAIFGPEGDIYFLVREGDPEFLYSDGRE